MFEMWNKIIVDYIEIRNRFIDENRRTSASFNFFKFRFFYVGETQHSYLLQLLLDPHGSHGQGNLFLREFLLMNQIEKPEEGTWQVTAEQGRIDVLIKRVTEPKSVIIIENKSHNAVDQKYQLYRYWEQEMVRPLLSKNQGFNEVKEFINSHPENFKLLYLAPNRNKKPSDHSLRRPEGEEWNAYDKILPMKHIHITFNNEIVTWLEQCKIQLSNDNHRLREYLDQYIEICKGIN